MQDQRFTGKFKQQFPLQTGRCEPCRDDCYYIFLVIVPVLLHGILGYIGCRKYSRLESRNLELGRVFAKLTPVENINTEPIESWQKLPLPEQITPTPNNPPWNGWVAFGVWVLSVFAIVILPSLFLLPYLATVTVKFENQSLLEEFVNNDPTAVLLRVIAVIPAHIATLLIAWLVVTRMRTYSFREMLGWKSGGMRWWHYIVIVLVFFIFANIVANYFPPDQTDLAKMLKSSRNVVFIFAFLAAFTAPLVEEVVYRGLLFSAFQRRFGNVFAVVVVTVLFTSVHIPQNLGSITTILLIALLSLIITLIRLRTKNLLPCIIFHTLINAPQALILILEPYLPQIVTLPDPAFVFHLV